MLGSTQPDVQENSDVLSLVTFELGFLWPRGFERAAESQTGVNSPEKVGPLVWFESGGRAADLNCETRKLF